MADAPFSLTDSPVLRKRLQDEFEWERKLVDLSPLEHFEIVLSSQGRQHPTEAEARARPNLVELA